MAFLLFLGSFYSILCCCRRASGPSSNLFLLFRDFCSCELSFLELHTLLMLRCELSSWNFTRSWCYVVNFLPRNSHALDATLWTFFLELHTLLMLRCDTYFFLWNFTRSWCYVVNFLPRTSHALDATLWTFFLELHTLLGGVLGGLITFFRVRFTWLRCLDGIRCELSF